MTDGSIGKSAAALFVAALMLAVPLSILSGSSDAASVTDGRESLMFTTSKPIDKSGADRLLSASAKTAIAMNVMDTLMLNTDYVIISDVSISNLEMKIARANKIDGMESDYFSAESYRMNISFKVVCSADQDVFGSMNHDMRALIFYFNDGHMSAGDELYVDTEYSFTTEYSKSIIYERNSAGDLVESAEFVVNTFFRQPETSDAKPVTSDAKDASVRFVHGSSTYEATLSNTTKAQYSEEMIYKFDGADASDITSVVPAQIDCEIDRVVIERTNSFKADGRSGSHEDDIGKNSKNYLQAELGGVHLGNAEIVTGDVAPKPVSCFGSGPLCLFTSAGDPSLESDAAMKKFLESVGTLSHDYSEAEDLYNDLNILPKEKSLKYTLIACAGICMVAVILLTLFIVSRQKYV